MFYEDNIVITQIIFRWSSIPGGIEIWICRFLWREENRRTRRKTLVARERTNKQLNSHAVPEQRIEPTTHWDNTELAVRGERITATPTP
jgi:hypothetical protein